MKKVKTAWVLAAALLLLAPTSVLAQLDSASKDFPDNQAGPSNLLSGTVGKALDIRIILQGVPIVNTASTGHSVPLNSAGFDTGAEIAAQAAKAVCLSAVLSGNYACGGRVGNDDCNGMIGGIPAAGDPSCCNLVDETKVVTIDCQAPGDGIRFWRISRTPGGIENFEIQEKTKGYKLNGLHHTTNAGNTVETDILPQYCVRVDRGPSVTNGIINFSVVGGSAAGSFSVDSTGKTDDILHRDIYDKFSGKPGLAPIGGLPNGGLAAVLLPNAAAKCKFEDQYQGPTVFLPAVKAQNVVRIAAKGVQDQIVSAETSIPGGNIPTLSEWGLIFLAAVLAISAIWMLRRRSQTGSPA